MRMKRCLSKGWKHQGMIYIFGGDDGDTVETFDFAMHMQSQNQKWRQVPINYKALTNTEKTMKSFSHSHPSHVI